MLASVLSERGFSSELPFFQELENTFDGWTGDLAHLTVLRESLSCYISAEDLSVLQERVELLHRQWVEICHQVSHINDSSRWLVLVNRSSGLTDLINYSASNNESHSSFPPRIKEHIGMKWNK